ncbi:MAG: oxygenase MpaB family protein [Marmoricola sp.]
MTEMTRRNVLRAGGALGAVGAMTLASPGAAWSWATSGSVAGSGTGADPRWVWDEVADPLMADVVERGDVAVVNTALRAWTTNSQVLPDGLPGDVRDFIEEARRLPSWADPAKLDDSFTFTTKRGTYLGVLYGLNSGMMSTAIPHEARAVYYSKGGADMKLRISRTAKLGYDIGTKNAFDPNGQMITTCVKTRMVHAAVRHLLPKSGFWKQTADQTAPISQRDMMITWHSLASCTWKKLTAWKIAIPQAEADGYLHSWQLTAHMLGIQDQYIPATWGDAVAQSHQVLDPVLAPTPEGIELADILLNLASNVDGGQLSYPFLAAATRYMLGDQITDSLQIPRNVYWDNFFRNGWPAFVAFKEAGLALPLAPAGSWMFDEFLRKGALFYLSDGKPISIEIPDANRGL